MRTTSGNKEFPGVDAQHSITLNGLVQRWREALADVWDSLLSDDPSPENSGQPSRPTYS